MASDPRRGRHERQRDHCVGNAYIARGRRKEHEPSRSFLATLVLWAAPVLVVPTV